MGHACWPGSGSKRVCPTGGTLRSAACDRICMVSMVELYPYGNGTRHSRYFFSARRNFSYDLQLYRFNHENTTQERNTGSKQLLCVAGKPPELWSYVALLSDGLAEAAKSAATSSRSCERKAAAVGVSDEDAAAAAGASSEVADAVVGCVGCPALAAFFDLRIDCCSASTRLFM